MGVALDGVVSAKEELDAAFVLLAGVTGSREDIIRELDEECWNEERLEVCAGVFDDEKGGKDHEDKEASMPVLPVDSRPLLMTGMEIVADTETGNGVGDGENRPADVEKLDDGDIER